MASLQEDTESQDKISSPVLLATKYSLKLKEEYEITFATQPPKEIQLECSICLQILSDPCILNCKCGYSFCRECIEPIRIGGNRCPLCNMNFSITLPNIRLDKTLNELEINCCNDNLGCKWTGELGSLSKHLNTQASNRLEGCEYVTIKCSLCPFQCVRKEMANHEGQQCAERQYTCEYCTEYTYIFKDVYTNHWPVCGIFKQACERGGNYSESGLDSAPLTFASQCLQDPSILAHNMTESKYKTRTQCSANGEPIDYIVPMPALAQPETNERKQINGQRTWMTISNFSNLKDPEDVSYSNSFYTHTLGYNMCLAIQHKSGYLSVSTHILKGEHDEELTWPLQGEVTIKLVGQDSERSHSRVVEYTREVEEECAGRVMGKDERSKELGKRNFIPYRSLHPNFIKEDSLWFDVQCKLYV